jgi:hypothetical protein
MRGRRDPQMTMLAVVDLEERVPRNHPLRVIKHSRIAYWLICRPFSIRCTVLAVDRRFRLSAS